MGYEIYKYISSAHHKSVTTDVSQQMATQNSRTTAGVPAAAPLLLPPLLILATTVSLASAARPAPANPSLQSAASAPVATDVEPSDAAGMLLQPADPSALLIPPRGAKPPRKAAHAVA